MKLNVSRGSQIDFFADKIPHKGMVVSSGSGVDGRLAVVVQTTGPIRNGAKLTLPAEVDTGGAGLAFPSRSGNGIVLELSVSLECVDMATIGK
jgi:hypothetical protein